MGKITKKTFKINALDLLGSGDSADSKEEVELKDKECKECKGKGEIDVSVRAPRILKCEVCDGTGKNND